MKRASSMLKASLSILIAKVVADALTTGFGLWEICWYLSEIIGNPGFLAESYIHR